MDPNCDRTTPITLIGKTLGERHRYLNSLINEKYERKKEYLTLDDLQDELPLDRILKIELAAKFQNIDYIIENLKHDDMLYVSKSLKCRWLIKCKFEQIINPQYLEEKLYPLMITTAVTKMKNWVSLNLKVEERCQLFFSYYYEKNNFKHAIKFLRNCSASFIKEQFSNVFPKISPRDFKILLEKNHEIAKIFFDSLATDEEIKAQYLSKEKYYFNTLKQFLKMQPEVVLDFTEKYFNEVIMKPFGPKATSFIMKYHKERYVSKPELYTSLLLDMKTLACSLNAEEAMNLVLKLARDKYLTNSKWFNYKKVELLIKRLQPEDRGALKKKVFLDKDIGNESKEWLYPKPASPVINETTTKSISIFEDREHYPEEYDGLNSGHDFRSMLKKRKYAKWGECKSEKTELDMLFEQYRVASFEKTLFELRKRIKAESSAQTRQYIMLVLVSKSGGREANIVALMQLLSKFINEPPQLRATIVRSLVKRAYVWRVPEETWKQLLEFAHGLGLDGDTPEADCKEGIHAVVIRQMMIDQKCNPKIFATYLDEFSTLTEYSLSIKEKATISDLLPKLLFTYASNEITVSQAVDLIMKLLDTLTAYKLSVNKLPDLISKIKSLAEKDKIYDTRPILKRLYRSRTARRELFKENFKVIESEDMYLNALRHDTEVLSATKLIELILEKISTFKMFLRKVFIYFNEDNGLAKNILKAIKLKAYDNVLAKPLTLLIGEDLESYLKNLDTSIVDKYKTFTACIRSNAHLAKPALDIDSFGWQAVGAKAVANKVLICRDIDINSYIQKLLLSKRTAKICLILAKRRGDYIDIFPSLAKMKPTAAIKYGLKILQTHKNPLDFKIWDIIKPLLENQDITSSSKIYQRITDLASMPTQIRLEYSMIMYNAFKDKLFLKSLPYLCYIENFLPNVSNEFIEELLQKFLHDFLPNKNECDYDFIQCDCLFIRILTKHLLLCKSQEVQKERLEIIGAVFFNRMEVWLLSDRFAFSDYLNEITCTFIYYKVLLNTEYVSCMPVMERVLTWMKTILPIEKHFKSYVHLQLVMSYISAVKEIIDNLSNHCIDESNQQEATKMVGNRFGQYIANYVETLTTTYSDLSKYLYKDIILNSIPYYLYFSEIFTASLINGIIDQSGTDNILCIYLLIQRRYSLKEQDWQEMLAKIIKNGNIETQMVLFAEMRV